ncbi:Uncharacterised protein [uncultured archaeon]|nr:Uncharacterised protein [uncultured archaeon]
MSEKIEWSLNVQVSGGPRIFGSDSLSVDAYDKFEIDVPETDGKVLVKVQPGDASLVQFVLIASDNYEDLTCTIDPDTVDPSEPSAGPKFNIDQPLVLIGPGASSLLGKKQKEFEFANAADSKASVVILIGRNLK